MNKEADRTILHLHPTFAPLQLPLKIYSTHVRHNKISKRSANIHK